MDRVKCVAIHPLRCREHKVGTRPVHTVTRRHHLLSWTEHVRRSASLRARLERHNQSPIPTQCDEKENRCLVDTKDGTDAHPTFNVGRTI